MTDAAKPKRNGRPPYEPTPEQRTMVRVLAGCGVAIEEIAVALQLNRRTLKRAFADELRDGHIHVKARVATALVRSALQGSIGACAYYLNRFGGPEWRLPPRDIGAIMRGVPLPNTTIIVHGGLAADHLRDAVVEAVRDADTPTQH